MSGLHGEAFNKRREWAEIPAQPNHTLWWVTDTHVPTWAEAFERQDKLGRNGPTPLAFNLKQPFDQNGAALPSIASLAREARQGVE